MKLAALLLLLLAAMLQLGTGEGRRRPRHRRGHDGGHRGDAACPAGCVCRPVGEVPCDWCVQTAAAGGRDGRVSCEGCGFGNGEQVRPDLAKIVVARPVDYDRTYANAADGLKNLPLLHFRIAFSLTFFM